MRIKLNPYRRRDGKLMVYVNSSNGPSIAISEDKGMPGPYSKGVTAGQSKLIKRLSAALRNAPAVAIDGSPDFAIHDEPKARLPIGDLYHTDVATIGGARTGSDGSFLICDNGKCIRLGEWIDA